VSVQMNTQAFRAGRLLVANPAWVQTVARQRLGAVAATPELSTEARALVDRVEAPGGVRRLLEIRVPELIAYQSAGYASEYVGVVGRVREAEAAAVPGETRLSEAVARYLFKLMAYKDEYEVARLHLKTDITRALEAALPGGATRHYNLEPTLLRAFGLKEKLKLGPWFGSVFSVLARMKVLRGTPLDPFGFAAVRRGERQLAGGDPGPVGKGR